METIEDIIREMRKKADQADFACCGNVDATFVRIFADRIEAAAHELDIENAVAAYAKVVEKKDMELARIILKIRNLSEEIFTFSSILCRGMCERCPSEKDCTSRKCRILIEELRQIANKE